MDDTLCRGFFLEPADIYQRQYEALRAVFLEGRRQNEVARQFGYTPDAVRQLVHQFRTACSGGTPPPFSTPRGVDAPPRLRSGPNRSSPRSPRSPTVEPSS
jgi:transposase-like protein